MYLNNHSYFLTLVTHRRKPILIDNIESLRCAFKLRKTKYDYKIEAIVILPDHFHMIITPKHSKEYSKIISYIKRTFIYGLEPSLKEESKLEISNAKHRRRHAGIWQERFYEHTIRDEKDLLKTLEYIQFNPIKHGLVDDVNDWKYSSFYKKRVGLAALCPTKTGIK